MNNKQLIPTNEKMSPKLKNNIKCRICYALDDPISNICDLISPCKCKGSMKYVHRSCLKIWRFKSKSFKEIKKCEYCLSPYTIEEEITSHRLLSRSISVSVIAVLFLFLHYILNLCLQIVFAFGPGIENYDSNIFYSFDSFDECTEDYCNSCFLYPKLTLWGTVVSIVLGYQLLKNKNIFHSFNYMFTLWRIVYFNFYIDGMYFALLNSIQLFHLFKDVYFIVDSIVYFALNFR